MRFPILSAALFLLFASSSHAFASDTEFFSGIRGTWSGPGQIVAGKYKGTKFICTFGGETEVANRGMDVDGSCRIGVFSQPMNAKIVKAAGNYIGEFLDGAKGDGMDVVGGRYTADRLVVDIKRENLNGILVANLSNPNVLNVTVSVKHKDRLIPVIGMTLQRKSGPKFSSAD